MELPYISAVRRNHAIEHATIAILFRRRGRLVSVVGRSDRGGFYVRGPFTAEEVESAAREAVARLSAGERHLAVTPLCGTNLAVTALLVGSAALLAVGKDRSAGWGRALTAAMGATVLSGRTGLWVQRHFTTDADIRSLNVRQVRQRGRSRLIRVDVAPA
jgi:hypothetical protein